MSERQTNIEFVTEMMEFSSTGPMMQIFIMDALDKRSEAVMAMEEKPEGWTDMINWDAWKRSAIELNQRLNKHYGDN
jgi:hypothetical protein